MKPRLRIGSLFGGYGGLSTGVMTPIDSWPDTADERPWMAPLRDDAYRREVWARVLANIEVSIDGCWLWQKYISNDGYGAVSVKKRMLAAYAVSYAVTHGPWSAGLQLDHLCRVRSCVNPAHLEPVTAAENNRRGIALDVLRARNASRTHCKYGHAFDEANTHITPQDTRSCRKCKARRARDSYARQPRKAS